MRRLRFEGTPELDGRFVWVRYCVCRRTSSRTTVILQCYLGHALDQVVRDGVNGIDRGWNYIRHDQISQISNNYYRQLYLVLGFAVYRLQVPLNF